MKKKKKKILVKLEDSKMYHSAATFREIESATSARVSQVSQNEETSIERLRERNEKQPAAKWKKGSQEMKKRKHFQTLMREFDIDRTEKQAYWIEYRTWFYNNNKTKKKKKKMTRRFGAQKYIRSRHFVSPAVRQR